MAFVSSVPILLSSKTLSSIGRNNVLQFSSKGNLHVPSFPLCSLGMNDVEFQTYSGGIDRISKDAYSITRYLFKSSSPNVEDQDKDTLIVAGLRQVFGNSYLMEEERAELYVPESNYRCNKISAKEYIRAMAKSSAYRKRFFESVSQYRFIELNFKHLLGRAPLNQVEYSKHFKIFSEGGYEAEIDSYIDDTEYDDVFGEDGVPFTRFMGTYAPINQFNRICAIEGGFAGSDKFKPQVLVTSLAANIPTSTFAVADGLPVIPNAQHPSRKYDLPSASLERFRSELELARAKAYKLQLDVVSAQRILDDARDYINPFKLMVSDVDTVPLYSHNYGNGAVKVFSGQYEGAPLGTWSSSGVGNINGPTRRLAAVVSKKEYQLERIKQLIVDLERRVAVLERERNCPMVTPVRQGYIVDDTPKITPTKLDRGDPKVENASTILIKDIDSNDDESGILTPKEVVVETKRELFDVGKLPKELIEEIEAEKIASGKDFLEGRGPRPSFPGDGSEMIVGG